MNTKIFIVCHKPLDYGYWEENKLYTPIQVGFAEQFLPVRDNQGENIAEWNDVYAELTAYYNIWKNRLDGLKYVGVCQYRRRLWFEEDTDFDEIFERHYAIIPEPVVMPNSVRFQYEHIHSKQDIDEIEAIVKELYPQYAEQWDEAVNNSNILLYANSFVLRVEDFKEYMEFLFTVLGTFLARHNFTTPGQVTEYVKKQIEEGKRHSEMSLKYDSQLCGFLGERLTTFWMVKDEGMRYVVPYTTFEGV